MSLRKYPAVPRRYFLVVLIPGLVALTLAAARAYLWRQGDATDVFWWRVLLPFTALALVGISWWRSRRLELWSLTAVGFLMPVLLFDIPGLPPASGFVSVAQSGLFFGSFVIGLLALIFLLMRHQVLANVPTAVWILALLVIALNPAAFLVSGLMLALPLAIALFLAPQYGHRSLLVLLPSFQLVVGEIFDPAYGILIWSEAHAAVVALTLIPVLLFSVVLPLLLLSSASISKQLLIVLGLVVLVLGGGELWRSIIFSGTGRGAYDFTLWFLRLGAVIQYGVGLVILALLLTRPRPVSSKPGPVFSLRSLLA